MPFVVACAYAFSGLPAQGFSVLALASLVALGSAAAPAAGSAEQARGQLASRIAETRRNKQAKQVVLFIGDGMGLGTHYATRIWEGQQEGRLGEEHVSILDRAPHVGVTKTYTLNAQTADSAASATAFMSGAKTINGVINTKPSLGRGECSASRSPADHAMRHTPPPLVSITSELGYRNGIVSTARVTHATPAAAYAVSADRNWEASVPIADCPQKDIGQQLADAMLGGQIDVAMGGGMRSFLPACQARAYAAGISVRTGAETLAGRVVIVHDFEGARVACAVLREASPPSPAASPPSPAASPPSPAASPPSPAALRADGFVRYFTYSDYVGSLRVSGLVEITARPSGERVLSFALRGVDPLCSGGAGRNRSNSCGVHVHEGESCGADAGGHLYDRAALREDPWAGVAYTATACSGKSGSRTDGEDLTARLRSAGVEIADSRAGFDALRGAAVRRGGRVLAGFSEENGGSHMVYEADRNASVAPSLAEMTAEAIRRLSVHDRFFLQVEGGRIDHALHANQLQRAAIETAAFEKAVQVALDSLSLDDSLIIATADHSHGLMFTGYCARGSPIDGLCYRIDASGIAAAEGPPKPAPVPEVDADGHNITVATFATGRRLRSEEPRSAASIAAQGPDFLSPAVFKASSERHSGEDVITYAWGAQAHLVGGTFEQHVLHHLMLHAMSAGGEDDRIEQRRGRVPWVPIAAACSAILAACLLACRRCCCRRGRAGQGIQLMDQPEASHVDPTSSAYAARYGGGAFGSGAAGAPKALAEGGRATGV